MKKTNEFQIGITVYANDEDALATISCGWREFEIKIPLRTKEEKMYGLVVYKDYGYGIQLMTGLDTKVWSK